MAVGYNKSPTTLVASRPGEAYLRGESASLHVGSLIVRQILTLVVRKQSLPLDEMEKVAGHFGARFRPVNARQ